MAERKTFLRRINNLSSRTELIESAATSEELPVMHGKDNFGRCEGLASSRLEEKIGCERKGLTTTIKQFCNKRKKRHRSGNVKEVTRHLVHLSLRSSLAPAFPALVTGFPLSGELHTVWRDYKFIKDCLDWHNLLRARHGVEQLSLDPALCEMAHGWATFLANINEFYHQNHPEYGENLFLWPKQNLPPTNNTTKRIPSTEVDGKYIATHWYRDHESFPYSRDQNIQNSYSSEFTQMVWANSSRFGCSLAKSISGKTIIVAYYYPKGNVCAGFSQNVVPPRELQQHQTNGELVRKVRLKL